MTSPNNNPKFTTRKSGRKRKKGTKPDKGETYKITYALIKEGKPIEEIAAARGLAVSTVEGHIVRGIGAGEVHILDLLSEDAVNEVADTLRKTSVSLGEVHNAFKGKYGYGVLRMVQAHLELN